MLRTSDQVDCDDGFTDASDCEGLAESGTEQVNTLVDRTRFDPYAAGSKVEDLLTLQNMTPGETHARQKELDSPIRQMGMIFETRIDDTQFYACLLMNHREMQPLDAAKIPATPPTTSSVCLRDCL